MVPHTQDMHVVDHKWVFKTKLNLDVYLQKLKARLVAKDFQQTIRVDYFETFSLVVKPITIRTIITLVVSFGWPFFQTDINNGLLNGELKKSVYTSQL